MRRPTSAWTTAILGTALTASTLSAQQAPTAAPAAGTGGGQAAASVPRAATPQEAGRGSRYALRNGLDYLKFRQYERALTFFREAEKYKAQLSAEEVRSLQQGIDSARRGLRELPIASVKGTATPPTRSSRTVTRADGSQVAAPSPSAPQRPTAGTAVNVVALPTVSEGPVAVMPAAPAPVVTQAAAPVVTQVAAALDPMPAVGEPSPVALPPLSRDAEESNPAPLADAATIPAAGTTAPAASQELTSTPVQNVAPSPSERPDDALPPLPDTPALPAAPPVSPPLAEREGLQSAQATQRPAPEPVPEAVPPLPDSLPVTPELAAAPNSAPPTPAEAPVTLPAAAAAEMPAVTPEPAPGASVAATPALVPAPATTSPEPDLTPAAAVVESTPAPVAVPEPAVAPGPAVEPVPAPPAETIQSPATPAPAAAAEAGPAIEEYDRKSAGLTPEQRRQVDEVALQQEEEAKRRAQQPQPRPAVETGPTPGSPASRLELTRAPSPTEARPLRAIPVPEEFVPLAKREWPANRKLWAAAGTCHMPLYFQDVSLERYGHSTEQFFGPVARHLTYPLDDPKQSNQRNQLTQWLFSYGLFAAQIVALPYNLVMDPPWECEYDLGYYRPGDRVPTDMYYLPQTGVGPPLRGARY